ncbi:MAG: amidase [Chloroflexi bacterium]|nr:amidase [Chloroflexota bacterium]
MPGEDQRVKSDLIYRSVAELAAGIQSGELSPVDLVAASLDRISQLDGDLNAFLEVWDDTARENALEAEKAISSGGYLGPLHGIPIGLKDLIDVAGKKTTGGSKVLANNVAGTDATVVQKLRSAGAILVGKLNLVEFAFGTTGLNSHTGDVKNPWDRTRITAGSSSGSAAAVASGMIPAALGTDTGGSIRMPAALCGIAGLKPTYGRVSRVGVLDLSWSMDHVGPMTRTTADCALMMNVLAGHDPRDTASSTEPVPDFTAGLSGGLKNLSIGVPKDYFFGDLVDPEVASIVLSSVEKMANAGAEIVELAMPWVHKGRSINLGVIMPEATAVHERMLSDRADSYTPAVRSRIQAGFNISAVDYVRAQRAREWFNHQMAESMARVDVLVTPTVPIQTPTIADCTPSPDRAAAGSELAIFTGVFDVTGQPSHSIPCGFTSQGLPVGMMITGHPFDEATVLQVGSAYEKLTDWHQRPPSDIPPPYRL